MTDDLGGYIIKSSIKHIFNRLEVSHEEELSDRGRLRRMRVVNFMMQKMNVEFADGADRNAVMKNVLAACRRVERDCEIYI